MKPQTTTHIVNVPFDGERRYRHGEEVDTTMWLPENVASLTKQGFISPLPSLGREEAGRAALERGERGLERLAQEDAALVVEARSIEAEQKRRAARIEVLKAAADEKVALEAAVVEGNARLAAIEFHRTGRLAAMRSRYEVERQRGAKLLQDGDEPRDAA